MTWHETVKQAFAYFLKSTGPDSRVVPGRRAGTSSSCWRWTCPALTAASSASSWPATRPSTAAVRASCKSLQHASDPKSVLSYLVMCLPTIDHSSVNTFTVCKQAQVKTLRASSASLPISYLRFGLSQPGINFAEGRLTEARTSAWAPCCANCTVPAWLRWSCARHARLLCHQHVTFNMHIPYAHSGGHTHSRWGAVQATC